MTQTTVWPQEFEWLHALMRSPLNTSPKFRIPDLLGACISLALSCSECQARVATFLRGELLLRARPAQYRTCSLWPSQWDELFAARGAPWNRYPHPMFELEHIASACVAIAARHPFGELAVLEAAKKNVAGRTGSVTGKSSN